MEVQAAALVKQKDTRRVAGGAATGGGMNFQAAVTAICFVRMARGSALGWLDGLTQDIPIAVLAETDGPGDDVRVDLTDGKVIEIQVKRGLKKGNDLWRAMTSLAQGLTDGTIAFGVLAVCPNSSQTLRRELARDIRRLGDGLTDGMSAIGRELVTKLESAGLEPQTICSRLRVVTVSALASADTASIDASKAELVHQCGSDVFFGYEPGNRQKPLAERRILPQPTGFGSCEREAEMQHVDFPCGVTTAAGFAPLDVPVPHRRKHEHCHAEGLDRHASSTDFATGRCCQRAEQETEMLDLLERGLLVPDTVTLEADFGQRRHFETDEIGNFSRQSRWRIDCRIEDFPFDVVEEALVVTAFPAGASMPPATGELRKADGKAIARGCSLIPAIVGRPGYDDCSHPIENFAPLCGGTSVEVVRQVPGNAPSFCGRDTLQPLVA